MTPFEWTLQTYLTNNSLGNGQLTFNKNGMIGIELNQRILYVQLNHPNKETVTFFSYLDKLPQSIAVDKLKFLLYANHFGYLTNEFNLGLSPHTDEVLIYRTMDAAGIRYETLTQLLAQLDRYANLWNHYLIDKDAHKVLNQCNDNDHTVNETSVFTYQRI